MTAYSYARNFSGSENKIPPQIVISDKPPTNGTGIYVHYEFHSITIAGWKSQDIRDIVKKNELVWLSDIESWHRELTNKATELTQWWWLLPASRLILWKTVTPFSLKPIIFALAVIELFNTKMPTNLHIMGAPQESIEYLLEWSKNNQLIPIDDRRTNIKENSKFTKLLANLKHWQDHIKQVAWLIRMVGFRKSKPVKPTSTIINSVVLDSALLDTIGDHFFGKMFDEIDGPIRKQLMWLYNDNSSNTPSVQNKLGQLGRRARFIFDDIQLSDIIYALWTSIETKIALRNVTSRPPSFNSGGINFETFPHIFLKSFAGQDSPFLGLVFYRQFCRIIKQTGVNTIFYPYEEKPLERSLLLAAQNSALPLKTIGFLHGVPSTGHLYLRHALRGNSPKPTHVMATGDAARVNLESIGVPRNQIIVIGSPRHRDQITGPSIGTRKRLLLLLGLSFELNMFVTFISPRPELLNKFDLTIRLYPYAYADEPNIALDKLRAIGVNFKCEGGDLMKQIDRSDIVLFESTSAAMQAALRGKPIIQLNICDIISCNHFFGNSDRKKIKYCHNVEDLAEYLDFLNLLSAHDYDLNIQKQRELIEELIAPVNKVALKTIIENNNDF